MMYALLAVVGALLGSVANLAIYRLGYRKSNASPWTNASQDYPRQTAHYIPIIGWLLRRQEKDENGKAYWLRPFAIELTWAIGVAALYWWLTTDGLTGGAAVPAAWANVWFWGYAIFFTMLLIATFIDFDQRIIPDSITVTGVWIALAIATVYPTFRLPVVQNGLAGRFIRSLHFADAAALPIWHLTPLGLAVGLGIYWVWILAILPKFSLEALNVKALAKVMISAVRFLQKNNLKVRTRSATTGRFFLSLGALGSVLLVTAWYSMPGSRESLFTALCGLGFGGMMIWSVRIVASHSLGQEAMGFGDVTLMAMIGSFLGWQASLISFVLSPFAAIIIAIVNYTMTKENELAFGPYLCLGATVTVLGWPTLWPPAAQQFFSVPVIMIAVLTFSLLMLAIMMRFVRAIKGI